MEKTLTWYVNQSRKFASLIAKHRDHYICLKCGRSAAGGYKIDASHIRPKGKHKSMSADVDNIKALCSACHRWWHSDVTDSGAWFKEKYPAWHENLRLRAMKTIHMGRFEWKKKYEELRAEYNLIING